MIFTKADFERKIVWIDEPQVIKLAGCGDKGNLNRFSRNIDNIKRIICPMIESDYQTRKFVETCNDCGFYDIEKTIMLETSNGLIWFLQKLKDERFLEYLQMNSILNIEIGTSDLSKDYNSDNENLVTDIVKIAFEKGIGVYIGGKMTTEKAVILRAKYKNKINGWSTRYYQTDEIENIDLLLKKEDEQIRKMIMNFKKQMAVWIQESNEHAIALSLYGKKIDD